MPPASLGYKRVKQLGDPFSQHLKDEMQRSCNHIHLIKYVQIKIYP